MLILRNRLSARNNNNKKKKRQFFLILATLNIAAALSEKKRNQEKPRLRVVWFVCLVSNCSFVMMKTNRKSKRTLESCKGTLKTDLKTKSSSMDRGIFPNVCSSHVNPFMPRGRRGTPQDAEKVLSPNEPWGPAAGSSDW